MKKLAIVILIVSSTAAWAQNKPVAGTGARIDDCKPIGRTEDGKLVYSMKCNNIPKPLTPIVEKNTAPPAESPVAEAPEEESKGGLFRFPFGSSIGVTNYKPQQGVGPSIPR